MFNPNRRFLRDVQQLAVRGNHLLYEKVGRGRYKLYFWPDTPITVQEIHAAAAEFRRPLTEEEISRAKAEAQELFNMIHSSKLG